MAKNAAGKSTSQRISDEIYATPLVQPQKIVRKVTKKAAKPTKKSVRFPLFYTFRKLIFFFNSFQARIYELQDEMYQTPTRK